MLNQIEALKTLHKTICTQHTEGIIHVHDMQIILLSGFIGPWNPILYRLK